MLWRLRAVRNPRWDRKVVFDGTRLYRETRLILFFVDLGFGNLYLGSLYRRNLVLAILAGRARHLHLRYRGGNRGHLFRRHILRQS